MAEKLKVALLQADLVWEKPGKNLENFESRISGISSDVDLIILPEMFPTGFSMNAHELAEETMGRSFRWMQKIASERNAAITGSVIVKEDDNYYNRLFFVFPDGTYKRYDKRHTFSLAGEDRIYSSGKERMVVSFRGWKICPLVCYDLRFPVWSRNTATYDVLLYVANWPSPRTFAWDTLLKARAIENLCYTIGVNRVGTDGNSLQYSGHSAVYDCSGSRISEISETTEEQEITLIKSHLKDTREKLPFLQDRDHFKITEKAR